MKIITAKVGNVLIGGDNPIVVQTMCNTHTADVEASYEQCLRLARAGAGLVRLTVQGMAEVKAISQIRERLRSAGIGTPLVADIHFRSDVALAVAPLVEKVRVNPGNFNRDHALACKDFQKLLEICRNSGTAIRIGINHGSLGERITSLYGNTPDGMARAAMEWLRMCIDNNFYNVVVSLKASNVLVMVEAYRRLQGYMKESGFIFPLHLGVTEAGNGDSARIKSAVGISTLLKEGLGDTIRVSLTEDPEEELPVGELIAEFCNPGRASHCCRKADSWQRHIVSQSCLWGPQILSGRIDDFTPEAGDFPGGRQEYLKDEILQACRKRFYRPEFVACPGCGRTMFDLESVFEQVKKATSKYNGLCIAVMGCIVNGPGEMADADFGYVGEGRSLVTIYRGREAVYRHIPQNEAIGKLVELIEKSRS